ncbi:MAG: amylo-alpha-1,6-glucosidase [Pedosphaera sp.]|nr:amylo-alpha-1,6-glucosidase [Pedosphaera sp.]
MDELQMNPAAGQRMVRYVGDLVTFYLRGVPAGHAARLRTQIGRADSLHAEIVAAVRGRRREGLTAWHDRPMRQEGDVWTLTVPLVEVGYFESKAYAVDERGQNHWPSGGNVAISVHPAWTRSGNTIYCAWPRQFGPNKTRIETVDDEQESVYQVCEREGGAVIPASGTLRDLQKELPHIIQDLGCRILHLLPVNPTPTTFARFGRCGSPYAGLDLTAIDPALIEFDQRTTGVQQFEELARATHGLGGRLFIDLVINHTGWGSTLWEKHPEWFHRHPDGRFASPGAWGTVWEDLVELDPTDPALWEEFAEAFLTWCRRGVDGFRCDAGYKVPLPVWRFITARVRGEFPDAVFLLEGLGGAWETTEVLLGPGGFQWAYSELFQNYGGAGVQWYLDYSLPTSHRCGTLVNYSETHDNPRLAAHKLGREWSWHRNQVCALTSVNGAWGFTQGVEWLAVERINVHSARGLSWGHHPNLVRELGELNRLLTSHSCFFSGAMLTRLSPDGSPVLALRRDSADGHQRVLILINHDLTMPRSIALSANQWQECDQPDTELLPDSTLPDRVVPDSAEVVFRLEPGACHCLGAELFSGDILGTSARDVQARSDWAVWALVKAGVEGVQMTDLPALARRVAADPGALLGIASRAAQSEHPFRLEAGGGGDPGYRPVVEWSVADQSRVLSVPAGHWLLVKDPVRFRVTMRQGDSGRMSRAESIPVDGGHVASFAPGGEAGIARLVIERYGESRDQVEGTVLFLASTPTGRLSGNPLETLVLLTNGRGAMVRCAVDLGRIFSKYDCLLGANLHTDVPVDRHVFVKRMRVWVDADGFISPLDAGSLLDFAPGPPAHWRFLAPAGDGRTVEVHLVLNLLEGCNTVVAHFSRPDRHRVDSRFGRPLLDEHRVRLTVRLDLEDRTFHFETQRTPELEEHFSSATRLLPAAVGFQFSPGPDRKLRAYTNAGQFHSAIEWTHCEHPVESTRGLTAAGDAFSPGWFELSVPAGSQSLLVMTAEQENPALNDLLNGVASRLGANEALRAGVTLSQGAGPTLSDEPLIRHLVRALDAFVVRRGSGRTAIAGYPWFLDWGRDTLIVARGMLAAGRREEVRQILTTFARFEQGGTLPNAINGEDASNRDTSDAPLWFGIACEEFAASVEPSEANAFFASIVGPGDRTMEKALRGIACGYLAGTENGIAVDAESGLVWSPGHFTWMDTSHPAGTPREGYPIEIQALWIRLLRLLNRLNIEPWEGSGERWADLAQRAENFFHLYFWLEECGWHADFLRAARGQSARASTPDNALRPNALFPIALDIDSHPMARARARRTVAAAGRWLLVPGAVRSLAALPIIPPLPIYRDGQLLNDPDNPYWGHYVGDEDTRRKPAYHNGTAWVWLLPTYCEALVKAHPGDLVAAAAARSHLGGVANLLGTGCLGHLPEILDGDAPHRPRGCDAQAWSVSEALRVWLALRQAGR